MISVLESFIKNPIDTHVFLSSPRGEARALRARKTLTARFTDFFTDLEKKTDCFAV